MKTLRALVLIADDKPDSENEIFDLSKLKLPEEKVSVRLNFDATKPVGRAMLKLEGNKVYADMEILDNLKGVLTPSIAGVVDKKIKRDDGVSVLEARIDFIALTENENSDSRIPKIEL